MYLHIHTYTRRVARAEIHGVVCGAEEKVAAGLAQIGAILQESRKLLMGGDRGGGDEDVLPPLAKTRAELKEACLQLQVRGVASISTGVQECWC